MNAFLVKVASEQRHGGLCEIDGFDPPAVTAFAERLRLGMRSEHSPITRH